MVSEKAQSGILFKIIFLRRRNFSRLFCPSKPWRGPWHLTWGCNAFETEARSLLTRFMKALSIEVTPLTERLSKVWIWNFLRRKAMPLRQVIYRSLLAGKPRYFFDVQSAWELMSARFVVHEMGESEGKAAVERCKIMMSLSGPEPAGYEPVPSSPSRATESAPGPGVD